MTFIPIKEYVEQTFVDLKKDVDALKVKPCFVIIQVNDDPASNSYIKGKINDAKKIGVTCILKKYSEDISQKELLKEINKVNKDKKVHGLIVQMPLPKQLDEEAIKLSINPKKDIDGFHPLSKMEPCTPKGIINYLKRNNIEIRGKNAVIIGRSNIVGKPMAKLLLKEDANTTVLHSKTSKEDMKMYLEHANIIVCAIGKKHFLDERFKYRKDAIIFDVGISRVDGVLCGDIKPEQKVLFQSPVPGGVGLLTRLTLLENLLEAYQNEI